VKKQTVFIVLVIAAILIATGIYIRSHGLSVSAFIDAHR
jgi:hypothetical protein